MGHSLNWDTKRFGKRYFNSLKWDTLTARRRREKIQVNVEKQAKNIKKSAAGGNFF